MDIPLPPLGKICIFLLLLPSGSAFILTDTLYVSNGTAILRLVPDGDGEVSVGVITSQDNSRAVGVAIDVRQRLLFYSDVSPDFKGLYRINLKIPGSLPVRIIQDIGIVNGLTVDWVSKLIYWTDESRQTIEASTYEGENRYMVVDTGLMWPRGILADPVNGYLYWGDQGERRVERCRLDGTGRTVLADSSIDWPNQLALDFSNRHLYWVDAYNEVMMTLDINDLDPYDPKHRPHRNYSRTVQLSTIYGMALSSQHAYFTTWDDGGVHVTTLGKDGMSQFETVISGLGVMDMFSIVVDDIAQQPTGNNNACGSDLHGGCSHICFTTSTSTHQCACPTYSSLVLGSDGKTCEDATEFLLFADKSEGIVGLLTLPMLEGNNKTPTSSHHKHILTRSPAPVAVGYDPVESMVYWSDVKDKAIFRIQLHGGESEVFLGWDDGVGIVDGLSIDWRSRNLYFTNRGSSRPKADGAVYHWQRVEMISLDKTMRKTVTSHVDKPRAITVDNENYYVYFSEWGKKPAVWRMKMDGSDLTVVAQQNISNPNGLCVHNGTVFLSDSNYDLKAPKKHVSSLVSHANQTRKHWTQLTSLYHHIHTPFGIAVTKDTLYISDWKESHLNGGIISMDRKTGEVTEVQIKMKTPTGLLYVKSRQQPLPKNPECSCSTGICVMTGKETDSCLCPDRITSQSCPLPYNFAVVSDLNTLKMVDLDNPKNSESTLLYGASNANFVAIALSQTNKMVFFSDLTNQTIQYLSLEDPSAATIFHSTTDAVDGIAVDDSNVYWTAYNPLTYEGYIAVKPINASVNDQPRILITDLHRPRAIALLDRFLYWTQTADPMLHSSGHVFKADLSTDVIEVLNDTRLVQPNALAVDHRHIYVGDGHYNKIDIFPLDACQKPASKTIMGSGIDHVFGMALYQNMVLFSSWHSNTLKALNASIPIPKGSLVHNITTITQGLYRPTSIAVYSSNRSTHSNSSCEEKNIFEKASPPVFHNCPMGELLILKLPPGANFTRLPFQLYATDYKQHNLSLSTNFPFYSSIAPSPIHLVHRLPKSPTHHLVYQATDDIGKTATCSFSVQLEDHEPPQFVHCPSDMVLHASSRTAIVRWMTPRASDNVGIQAILGPSKSSGDEFAIGKYDLKYVAIDWDGNKAHCNFSIEVNAKEAPCQLPDNFMNPRFGSLHCAGNNDEYSCITTCSNSHLLNSDARYHEVFCSHTGSWHSWFPKDYYHMACLRRSRYRVIHETFQYWLPENCRDLDKGKRQELTDIVLEKMTESNICQMSESGSICSSEHVAVICERKISSIISSGRRRRSTDHLNLAIQLTLLFNIQEEKLDQVSVLVSDLSSRLTDFFSQLDLIVEDMVITSHNGHMEALPYIASCPDGSVEMERTCVMCPAGYHHKTKLHTCEACPPNTYQDLEGQTNCLHCPNGLLSHPGSYNDSLCMTAAELYPSHHSTGLTLGTAALLLLLFSLVIFLLYAIHRRRRRGKKKYRVADHCVPDPALERLSSDHNVLMAGHGEGQRGQKKIKDGDCDTIMTVMFSPAGERLQDNVVEGADVDSDHGI